MAEVEFVEIEQRHIEYVAARMREADRVEVMAACGHSPMEALQEAVSKSQVGSTVLIDGEPVAIMGLAKGTVLTTVGAPWMLGTDVLFRHPRKMLEWGRTVVAAMLEDVDALVNYVHADNTASIRWLKRLGFSFGKHVAIGVNGEKFARFWMEKKDV